MVFAVFCEQASVAKCFSTDGVVFWLGGIVGDGYCVVCGKDFQDEGLFCSKECELEYRRNELRG